MEEKAWCNKKTCQKALKTLTGEIVATSLTIFNTFICKYRRKLNSKVPQWKSVDNTFSAIFYIIINTFFFEIPATFLCQYTNWFLIFFALLQRGVYIPYWAWSMNVRDIRLVPDRQVLSKRKITGSKFLPVYSYSTLYIRKSKTVKTNLMVLTAFV